MKVILYMAITANGMIAKLDNDTPWSDEEWRSYYSHVKAAGNLIIGSKTYPLFEKDDFVNMGDPAVVVLTRDTSRKDNGKVKFAHSPQEALEYLKEQGFDEIYVTGGGETNSSFMREGLIDEIYLDVEPLVFGKGIPLFKPAGFEYKLKLLESKKLSDNTIQLHYKVKE